MIDKVGDDDPTHDYLTAVYVEREYARAEFGDDYESGKSPGLLLAALVGALGEVADAVIGNPHGENRVANCTVAMEQLVVVGGVSASLYELLGRLLDEFASEDASGAV